MSFGPTTDQGVVMRSNEGCFGIHCRQARCQVKYPKPSVKLTPAAVELHHYKRHHRVGLGAELAAGAAHIDLPTAIEREAL